MSRRGLRDQDRLFSDHNLPRGTQGGLWWVQLNKGRAPVSSRKQPLRADQVSTVSDLPQAGPEADSTSGARDVFGARDVEGGQLPTTLKAQAARSWLS